MPVGFRFPNGADLDQGYAARITDPGPLVGFRGPNGADLAYWFEKWNGAGQAGAANMRGPNGNDLSLYFTTQAGVPVNWATADATRFALSGTATASITWSANGNIAVVSGTSRSWLSAPANLGNQYQIEHTITGGSGGASVPSGWLNLDSGQTISISRSTTGTSSVVGTSRIRRKSDGVVVCSGGWAMTAEINT